MKALSFKFRKGIASALAFMMALTLIPVSMLAKTEKVMAAATVEEGTYDFTPSSATTTGMAGITLTNFTDGDNKHGFITNAADATIVLNLSQKATITVLTCGYNAGTNATMTSSSGNVSQEGVEESGIPAGGLLFTVSGAEGETTLTFSNNTYVHKLTVEYETEPVYITDDTSIIYGSIGGTPNFEFSKTYSEHAPLSSHDSVDANGAVKWSGAKAAKAAYGIYVGSGASLEVGVTGSAKITFVTSKWNDAGQVISVTSSDSTGTIDERGISECKVGADGDKLTVTYTAGNEANATLTFSFTGTVYVPALIIEPIKESGTVTNTGTTTWYFDATEDENKFTGDFNGTTGEFKGLKIDATIGKLTARERDSQFNEGAKISVPVGAKADVTVVSYPGYHNYTVGGKAADADAYTYNYVGEAGYVDIVATGNSYLYSIKVENKEEDAPVVLDTSKIDVWDFGAEALDAEKYNNNLTVDVINGFYPGVAGGTAGKNIASFTAKDAAGKDAVKFNDGGYSATHRLRTTNTALTRKDEKSLKDKDGVVYSGYIYSNKSSDKGVNFAIYLYEGDILTAYLGSNGTEAVYKLMGPDGKEYATFDYTAKAQVEKATFYAASEGWYTLWCTNEKLVCARILREHVPTVTVSGSIYVPGTIPNDYKLVFVNNTTKKVTEATVTDGNYTVDLCGKYDYTVALENANGFVVNAECNAVTLGTEAKAHNVTVKAVNLVTLTGSVTGLEDKLANMKLTFASENVYVPELNVNTADGTFTLKLEKDVTYAVTADGVNDYALNTTSISASADGAKNIEFTKKPVYPVAVHVVGVSDTTGATVTFKNINEEGYNYTFGIEENVSLRDGQYKVVIAGIATAPVVQGATSDAIVNGAATEVTIPLEEISSWDFAVLNNTNKVETINGQGYYAGLKVTNVGINKTYLLANGKNADSTITVPNVKKGSIVTIKYCYCASFKAGDKVIDERSGSTGQIDSVAVTAAEDGDFVITTTAGTNASETYFCAIEVKETGDYRSTLHVGADKEFNTINDALAAARKMTRTSEQAVTIKVDPGDYEEMLVIDIPNVRLVNASATPSIALKDKGVGIDDNAVRVTWYYGHGYTYYSMGSDCKYNMDILAANKANGYASFVNPG